MLKIKRFRLREGCEPPKRVYFDLGHDISLLQDWTHKDSDKLADDWDLQWFIVLDEEFCQPYTPFYAHIDDDISAVGNDVLVSIVENYNERMHSLAWLEER